MGYAVLFCLLLHPCSSTRSPITKLKVTSIRTLLALLCAHASTDLDSSLPPSPKYPFNPTRQVRDETCRSANAVTTATSAVQYRGSSQPGSTIRDGAIPFTDAMPA